VIAATPGTRAVQLLSEYVVLTEPSPVLLQWVFVQTPEAHAGCWEACWSICVCQSATVSRGPTDTTTATLLLSFMNCLLRLSLGLIIAQLKGRMMHLVRIRALTATRVGILASHIRLVSAHRPLPHRLHCSISVAGHFV
jgi:hypothetical protein